jgi:phosphatidylglycerol---prolipoprotein diacylglyceryl transferase
MYPSLFELFQDLFGIEINALRLFQMFGTIVAIAFLLCAYVFAKELRRKEAEGKLTATFRKVLKGAKVSTNELAGQFIFGYIVGWKLLSIPFYSDLFNADPRGYILSSEGSHVLGLLVGAAMTYWKYRTAEKERLPEPKEITEKMSPAEHVGNMTLLAALFGFLGAKIFHLLENFSDFIEDPAGMFLSFGGLTMYGGLIMGGAAVLIYARKQGFSLLQVMDACAPGLFLAYGVGRLGCHMAGDGDWGIVNSAPKPNWMSFLPDWFWAYDYPNNVNHDCNPYIEGTPEFFMNMFCDFETTPHLVAPVFPTPLYEAIACIGLFFIFWYFRKRIVIPGLLFSLYLIFNGMERFFVELIRVNTTLFSVGGFRVTQAEVIALTLMTLGIVGVILTRKRYREQHAG